MPRLIAGIGLGGLFVLGWALLASLIGGVPGGFPGVAAVLLAPGVLGAAVGGLLSARWLEQASVGLVIGAVLVMAATWGAGYFVAHFLLTHSFDLLEEVAVVFATLSLGAVVAAGTIAAFAAHSWRKPAGRFAASIPLTLVAAGMHFVMEAGAHIVGFEVVTLAAVAVCAAVSVPALRLLAPPALVARRGALVALAGVVVVALAGCLLAYTALPGVRWDAWSGVDVAQRLGTALNRLTDADLDGVSGLLGHPDCSELDPNVFPGTYERPGDGRDDNCMGGDPSIADVAALWHPGGPRALPRPRNTSPTRYNLLLITIDAVRADHLSLYGYERPTSVNLDNLGKLSLVFDQAWSASNFTSLSLYSLFTATYPSSYLELENIVSRRGVTLGEWLQAAGYRTEAVVDLEEEFRHVSIGFDAFDQSLGVRARSAVRNRSTGSTARELTELAVAATRRLATREQPFFLWVHYSEPHAAYLAHPEFPFGDGLIDRYDGEIAFADAAVGELLAAMRADGRLADTVIAVTSDHGEAFDEHGVATHGQTLYEEELRVPLIVYLPPAALPEAARGRRVASPVDLTDLVPTLLDGLGLPLPRPVHGESLLPHAIDGRPLGTPEAFAETRLPHARLQALRRGDEKIIIDLRLGAGVRFDLAADPGEQAGVGVPADSISDWTDVHLAFPRLGARGLQALPPP